MSDLPPVFWVAFGLTLLGLIVAAVAWGHAIHLEMRDLKDALLDLDEEQTAIGRRVLGLPDDRDRP